ncbi:DUF72 domain-containing protein [Salegentibacter salegens]|uniref:Uncharacterized conserved protein YecE, DUF72 family n=1 Tax=Salegentibacter salegens TaxID=143223 RepID=A0A1M7J3E1_9FLAO|nr:DUF72 domain-containing protein [Salegentibacter salegens]PRX47375.1 uncharacterized protein YecE (DUF72 family) [Salegentibacter salegens]SHM47498.1 Uncharacterized conserved protein YecE, DUF72 family [Salegentibacter salegens]
MNFGKVDHPENIDFTLPETHPDTIKVLNQNGNKDGFKDVRIGCAKWNRKDLKNFYPRGTKDELVYYSSQFNSIEFNGSFYRMYPEEQFEKWYGKADENFKFFPKVPRLISHIKRLNATEELTDDFVKNLLQLKEKLGMVFLQMREDFAPKSADRLDDFLTHWPKEIPLSAELRNVDWYADEEAANQLYALLKKRNVAHIITDTAGRRDLIHMRLSNTTAFIRYNGANHSSDYTRLDDWLDRLEEWHKEGLENVYFFIHQNVEEASPLLSAYFIKNFNKRFKTDIKIPKTLN